jgi:hypothetical protein
MPESYILHLVLPKWERQEAIGMDEIFDTEMEFT